MAVSCEYLINYLLFYQVGYIRMRLLKYIIRFVQISHSVVTFEVVDFLWNRTVDSLKTSFHLLL